MGMKLKLKLKWNVDLLPGIKICKPRPVSAQKQAELGKQVSVHGEIYQSGKTPQQEAAIGGSVDSCAGTVSNVSNGATQVKDILRRKPRK